MISFQVIVEGFILLFLLAIQNFFNYLNFIYIFRLLQSYNINVPEESDKGLHNDDEMISSAFIKEHNDSIKDKKKSKNGKAKIKKSDNGKSTDENNSSIILNLNKEKGSDEWKNKSSQKSLTMEDEDIESLISSNKIPVPNSNSSSKASSQTKNSDSEETVVEYDNPIISAIDNKQYEYILQKCSIRGPGMMQKKPNLTQKSKNILKAQNAPAISKVSAQQKIMEKNAKRIQKLGQIITQRPDNMDQNHDTSDISVDKILGKDLSGLNILKNIQLNDECTIETIPPKACKAVDTNSMKMKWQLSNSYTQIKKNLNALSKNLNDGQVRKKNVGNNESSFSNPVKRLETNPSISVRELFPGEEEMSLHCSIEFGNVKGVTPEGWEKCNSVIQYDSITKKLWHDLQKPYGNQSSFLRHLILLEKYFRNGDLVLSPNANTNAVTYSESVQNRLRAYDNIPSANGDLSNHGLTAFLKNSSVTLIPHVVPSPPPTLPTVISENMSEVPKKVDSNSLIEFRKQKTHKSNSGKSLLKTNQLSDGNKSLPAKLLPKSTSVEILPPPPPPPLVNQAKIPKNVPISMAQINQSVDQSINVAKIPKNLPLSLTQLEKMGNQLPPLPSIPTPRPPTPRPDTKITHMDFLKPIQPVPIGSDSKTSSSKSETTTIKPKASLPPELIAINPQYNTQRKSIENVLKNIQQLAKNSMTPPSPVTPSTSLQNLGFSPINPPTTSISVSISKQPETITTTVAPTSSTPVKKSKGSGKQWRPTLIPITDEAKSKNARDVLYQTADGRRLPSLVQVMSGGKPYHISIQDYNKMCVMRREKLLHMQKSDKKKSSSSNSGQTDPTKDAHPSLTIVAQISNKPPSPETLLPMTVENHPITLNIEDVKLPSAVTITKADENDTIPPAPPTTESDAASILKSVGLKNITITSVDDSKTPSPVSIQTSTLTTSVELNPITVTTDSAITTLAAITSKALPITSQAVILPKIPKSLTVIPQLSVTSCSSTPVSITLTPSVAITTVTTPVVNEPPELIPVSSISTPPPQTEP